MLASIQQWMIGLGIMVAVSIIVTYFGLPV